MNCHLWDRSYEPRSTNRRAQNCRDRLDPHARACSWRGDRPLAARAPSFAARVHSRRGYRVRPPRKDASNPGSEFSSSLASAVLECQWTFSSNHLIEIVGADCFSAGFCARLSLRPFNQTCPHQRNSKPAINAVTHERKNSAGHEISFTMPVTAPIANPNIPPMIIIFFILN